MMDYGKFAGPVPRILVLESQYWLDAACARAADSMGWELHSVPVTMEGVLPKEQIAQMLRAMFEFKPDFVLSINLSGMDMDGIFARLFEDLGVPYVAWFVDDPRTIIMGRTSYAASCSVALSWEAAYTDYLREVGFPLVETLPLAVDPFLFDAEPSEIWTHPPTFVGNSMLKPSEYEWSWLSANDAERNSAFASAIRDELDCGAVTRERFAEGLDALLPKSVVTRMDEHERRHAEIYFFVEGTRRLREKTVLALEPEGLEVRGDDGWCRFFPRVGPPVEYSSELARFYRDCEVNLNITSIQMASTVNQRVFDCPAAGGFLLTDAQSEIETMFEPGKEMVCYRNLDECRELLKWYRSHPGARREVTSRARRRILGEHTYAHRLQRIVEILKRHFS